MKYYDWQKTLSFDAFITLVIGARSIGKTYGLRIQAVNDFFKNGYRFCEILRYENEINAVGLNYFDKMQNEGYLRYKEVNYQYKYKNRCIYLAPEDSENWTLAGYLVSLTEMQKMKKQTFSNIRRIIFDEAIIDKDLSPYSRYLKNEFNILMNVISTLIRENDKETLARIYLLGNAVDLNNPYFDAFNIKDIPNFGYYWKQNKNVLIHYAPNKPNTDKSKIAQVLGSKEKQSMFDNRFKHDTDEFIEKKNSDCDFQFSVIYNNFEFGVWEDYQTNLIYISNKIPKNLPDKYRLTITMEDYHIDNTLLKSRKDLYILHYKYRQKRVRFETSILKEKFLLLMKYIQPT